MRYSYTISTVQTVIAAHLQLLLLSVNEDKCFVVPNVVHYVMIKPTDASSDQKMTFLQYLSLLGVHQHIKPRHIIIHGNVLPRGDWWSRTVNDVANIYFVNVTDIPVEIYGKPLIILEHRTDIMRYRILYGTVSLFLRCAATCLLSFAKYLHKILFSLP